MAGRDAGGDPEKITHCIIFGGEWPRDKVSEEKKSGGGVLGRGHWERGRENLMHFSKGYMIIGITSETKDKRPRERPKNGEQPVSLNIGGGGRRNSETGTNGL